MRAISELYEEALRKASDKGSLADITKQLDCLFNPPQHFPHPKAAEMISSAGKTNNQQKISKDVLAVLQALNDNRDHPAFILIAPAFMGQFSDDVHPGMVRNAFKELGFSGLLEVAVFADILTLREALEFEHNIHTNKDFMLTSCCCPMWLAMIKKMYSDLVPHMPPSVSPMIAAGRVVKKFQPESLTVFVGPCVAKKAEAREKDIVGAVDYVLTFQETQEMFDSLGVNLLAQKDTIKELSSEAGRIYARTGGVSAAVQATLKTLNPHHDIELTAQQADGIPACRQMIDDLLTGKSTANFFEGMGCVGGCVGGPKSLLKKDTARDLVNTYGKKALYKTPLDNPYVLKLLYRLGFESLESLLEDKNLFVRSI
ncbi:[Fe-Fe] hydrogenase large subunit C-terminal domain-containing protein [Pectinatus frisingensis]|uniref:[Fe-Fe] hydrogenase large subunit C-terminal domain-containing protein n=1 Tax=Pectinatus frisingensis TaxID=865 RepID=UPI0018C4CACF|nr:[Fe-Fe] hydrogenase large subunit C-terminal domain-containing protein [Pectinatus frisingensis]